MVAYVQSRIVTEQMARRKIANPQDMEAGADLPDLTAQQMKFVEEAIQGKNATDAYRAAYDTSRMLKETVWSEASRLWNNPQVAAWISQARIAGLGEATVSLSNHIRQLERIREMAILAGNHGAAAQCEQLRGKAQGHYTERLEITNKHDPLEELRQIAQTSPAFAAQLARDSGIPWDESVH